MCKFFYGQMFSFFVGYIPKYGIAGSHGNSVEPFKERPD